MHKGASVGALCLSLVLAATSLASRVSVTDARTVDTKTELDELRQQNTLQQREIDQYVALQEQIKALQEQNASTEKEVHDLSVNLDSFESRFYDIPRSSTPAPRR